MVSLLYQFPEAAADASDAAAKVQLCTGRGNTLQTALTEAERGLPRKASYRLCEYLLLNAETTLKTIRQAETVLKEEPVQGLSARVLCMDLSGEELAAADGENELFPEQLLQAVKEAAPQAPHLYKSRRNALLAPVLILTDGAIENAEEMLLLTETENTRLTRQRARCHNCCWVRAESTLFRWGVAGDFPALCGIGGSCRRWLCRDPDRPAQGGHSSAHSSTVCGAGAALRADRSALLGKRV